MLSQIFSKANKYTVFREHLQHPHAISDYVQLTNIKNINNEFSCYLSIVVTGYKLIR